jgi:uncharacterized repeat protein (TIGR01451 family)
MNALKVTRIFSILGAVLLSLALATGLWAAVSLSRPGQAAAPISGSQSSPVTASRVETATDRALLKIEPSLRSVAQAGNEESLLVLVIASSNQADFSTYGQVIADTGAATYAASELPNSHRIFMRVEAGLLLKLASLPDVAAVTGFQGQPAPNPPDPEAPGARPSGQAVSVGQVDSENAAAMLAGHRQAVAITRDSGPNFDSQSQAETPDAGITNPVSLDAHGQTQSSGQTEHWFENDTQGVRDTWNAGILGEGDPADPVKIAVIDTGVDFCNPALINRWAVMTGGAYDGWPIAYDDHSASDFLANYPDPGSGYGGNWGWYVNASTAVAEGTFVDSLYGKSYTTPGVSQSGTYYYGYHPDTIWHALQSYGSSPVILVADVNTAGVYDTVFIDANWDGVFDTPFDKTWPVGCVDWTGPGGPAPDGIADDSYGLLYWISDGTNPLPGVSSVYGSSTPIPPAGQVVLLMINDIFENGGDHGTLCASSAAGAEPPGIFYDWAGMLPAGITPTQIVQGPGSAGSNGPWSAAKIIPIGNTYAGGNSFNEYFFTVFGYDGTPATSDDPNIVSMSYGSGYEDADAWDFQSEWLATASLWFEHTYPGATYVSAAGNGGHGYGTVNTPGPVTGVTVGASTQYGPYNVWGYYEGVSDPSMFNYQDVQPWSDRGPTAMGTLSPHVVANGAWGSGAIPLNLSTYIAGYGGNGAAAWELWGGTSRATPVTAGILSLIYDGYWQGTGTYPGWRLARELLMNGTRGTYINWNWNTAFHYDEDVAGAGQVNAFRSALVARGDFGIYVDPPFYQPGSYPPGSDDRFESFAMGMLPGETEVTTFTVYNPAAVPVTVGLWDEQLQEVNRYDLSLTTLPDDPVPSNYEYGAPDYVIELSDLISQNAGADLMVVRIAYPFEDFASDPAAAPEYNNKWIGLIYQVFDENGDGWWNDLNLDGRVDISPTVAGPDHELDLDDEYLRMTYSYLNGTMQELRVRDPFERGTLGGGSPNHIYLGLAHTYSDGTGTDMSIEVIFYDENDWEQVSVEPLTLTVPGGTPSLPGEAVFTATIAAMQMGNDVFYEDFESGLVGWTTSGLWHAQSDTACITPTAQSPTTAAAFNIEAQCDYHTGSAESGALTRVDPVSLPSGAVIAQLSFWSYEQTECAGNERGNCHWDVRYVEASRDLVNWDRIWTSFRGTVENGWYRRTADLSAYIGGNVYLRFGFDTLDNIANDYIGWYIDDVRIQTSLAQDDYGQETGRIIVFDPASGPDTQQVVIPIQKQVWFDVSIDPIVGGTPEANTPYDNGSIYGAMDWYGDWESGDWRFYPFIIDSDVPSGTMVMVDNTWQDYPTDIDTLILSPVPNWNFATESGPPGPYSYNWFGPYTLDDLGYGSVRINNGRPNWIYQTNVGADHEFVSAPAGAGLHMLAHQAVLYGGEMTAVPFTTTVGLATASPNPVVVNGLACSSCTIPISFKSGLGFEDGLASGGTFGWYQPVEQVAEINLDESWYYTLTLADSFRLEVRTWEVSETPDIDLYVWQDGGDGIISGDDILVGSSEGSDANEAVTVYQPGDGLYFIEVYGYSVSGAPGQFGVLIRNVNGSGAFHVSGLPSVVEPGVSYPFDLHIDAPPGPGAWEGLLLIGPTYADQGVEIPVAFFQAEATKQASQHTLEVGDLLTYTLAVTAAENAPTATYTLSDILPVGVEFVSVDGAAYAGGTITWNDDLVGGEAHLVTLVVRTMRVGLVENTAYIRTDDEWCPFYDSIPVQVLGGYLPIVIKH